MRRALFVMVLSVACAPRIVPGAACDLTSDCDSPLVCRNDRCRIACVEARDCDFGLRCVQSNEGPSCSLPPEETCATTADCPASLRCVFGQCRSECVVSADCTRDGECVEGTCRETPSGSDAGPPVDAPADAPTPVIDAPCVPAATMTCGNGVLDRCNANLSMLSPIITGTGSGEVELLPPHAYDSTNWAYVTDIDAPLRPEVSLGLSAGAGGVGGFGVVANIHTMARRPQLFRFSLEDLAPGAPFVDGPDYPNVASLSAGEDGASVRLFALLSAADPDGHSGWAIAVGETTVVDDTISPSSPPNITRSRLGFMGGTRSIAVGDAQPHRFILPETLHAGHADGAIPVLGSITGTDGGSYHATRADALMSLSDFHMHVSGGADSVALLATTGTTLGIWDVLDSPVVTDNETQRMDAVVPFTVPALAGLPAIDRFGEDEDVREHLLAVPVVQDRVGSTRFYETTCPDVGGCNTPVENGELQARTDRPPVLVRLARLPGGYALGSLEPRAEEGLYDLHVRFIRRDGAWVELTPNEPLPPLVSDDATSGWVTRDFELRAVSDGTTVTIVVATVERNVVARRDRLSTFGFRACIAR